MHLKCLMMIIDYFLLKFIQHLKFQCLSISSVINYIFFTAKSDYWVFLHGSCLTLKLVVGMAIFVLSAEMSCAHRVFEAKASVTSPSSSNWKETSSDKLLTLNNSSKSDIHIDTYSDLLFNFN